MSEAEPECGGVMRAIAMAPVNPRIESRFKLNHAKELHIMESSTKTALVIAFIVIALLLLLFGGGMATGTMMSGGMMGSGSMGGFSWMWLPTLLVVVLGIVIFSVLFGKK